MPNTLQSITQKSFSCPVKYDFLKFLAPHALLCVFEVYNYQGSYRIREHFKLINMINIIAPSLDKIIGSTFGY